MEVHGREEPRRTPRFLARELNSCVFARTAITEHHSLGCWSERNVFSHGSVGWKSRIQVFTALVFPEASFSPYVTPGCVFAVSSRGPFCVCVSTVLFSLSF